MAFAKKSNQSFTLEGPQLTSAFDKSLATLDDFPLYLERIRIVKTEEMVASHSFSE